MLTTYRRNGAPVATSVGLAVDGERAVFRTFEKAGKTRRIRIDPTVEVAPSTWRGAPTGAPLRARAEQLYGLQDRSASKLVSSKYPLLHGVLVPLAHRALRVKTGRTVHFELTHTALGEER